VIGSVLTRRILMARDNCRGIVSYSNSCGSGSVSSCSGSGSSSNSS
jgi:hypothetical protein